MAMPVAEITRGTLVESLYGIRQNSDDCAMSPFPPSVGAILRDRPWPPGREARVNAEVDPYRQRRSPRVYPDSVLLRGHVAVVDGSGEHFAWSGDAGTRRFFRSSAKAFQAIPLVSSGDADTSGVTTEELALAAASHDATERHQAIACSIVAVLDNLGVLDDATRRDLLQDLCPPITSFVGEPVGETRPVLVMHHP